MPKVYRRPGARRDLVAHYVYLFENTGEAVAERFLTLAESSFNDLADHPEMSAPLVTRHLGLKGVRKWRAKDFDNHMIFYLPRADGVSIVRVLHASRNWWHLLGIEIWQDKGVDR